jgi:hypothetical protein
MVQLNKIRVEAMAQGVADGQTIKAAAFAAGYSRKTNYFYQIARRPWFKARVEVLEQERRWGGSRDLAPIISLLMQGALKAMEVGTLEGINTAARMIAEAGKLKQLLPAPETPEFLDYTMNREDWMAKFAPKGSQD